MARYDADGRRVRNVPVPDVNYDIDHRDAGQLLAQAHQQLHRIGHFASECMQDHLGDEGVIRDMHDIIGAVGHLQSNLHLVERAIRVVEQQTDGA